MVMESAFITDSDFGHNNCATLQNIRMDPITFGEQIEPLLPLAQIQVRQPVYLRILSAEYYASFINQNK